MDKYCPNWKACKEKLKAMQSEDIRKELHRRKVDKQAVYEYLATIPKGRVVTYGQIAKFLGNPNLARTVGNILHENPDGDKYPCYKVVNAQGKLAENYAFGGIERQKMRLEADGIIVNNNKVDLKKYQWSYEIEK